MSTINDCLNKIIGLSETDCECFDTGKPVDANVSNSGLFLDQLDGINLKLASADEDCEEGGLWDILAKSRNNAIADFKSDLQSALLTRYKQRRQPFIGQIGSTSYKNNLSLTSTYAGVEFFCDQIVGGTMKIRRIGLLFANSGTFTISVYSNVDEGLVDQYSVTAIANTLTWFTIPGGLSLEMDNETGTYPRYFFVYEVAQSGQPKDIQGGCGCNTNKNYKYYWNTNEPKFASFEKDRWSEYVMLTGVTGETNTLLGRDSWGTQNYLNGLVFDVAFTCAIKDLICTEQFDYETNPLALVMAYAVRYKAGIILLDKILASGEINRYTMMDRERLMGKKNTYAKEYQSRIDYLVEQINYKANDCLVCDDTEQIFKSGIFA